MEVIVGAFGVLLAMGLAIATYCLISYAVLFLVGKALPLAGRRRQR